MIFLFLQHRVGLKFGLCNICRLNFLTSILISFELFDEYSYLVFQNYYK